MSFMHNARANPDHIWGTSTPSPRGHAGGATTLVHDRTYVLRSVLCEWMYACVAVDSDFAHLLCREQNCYKGT